MARRRYKGPQGKKIQPAVKTLTFQLTANETIGVAAAQTLDLSQCASLVNRRFYRQGLNWAVAGFTIYCPGGGEGSVAIYKIPDTWVASNAWHKGFAAWQQMNREALDNAESVRPKFLDFKVFMDAEHYADGVDNNLIPEDSVGNEYVKGEWEYSQVVVPNPSDEDPAQVSSFDIMWTGANYTGAGLTTPVVSLIEGYAASRSLPDILDPNTPADASDTSGSTPENWISAIQNEGNDQVSDVIDDMIFDNNQAPYPFENGQVPGAAPGTVFDDTMYPGGANQAPGLELVHATYFTARNLANKVEARGSNFQGGLIRVVNIPTSKPEGVAPSDWSAGGLYLQVHLAPGPHRGYMCQDMKEV